MRIVTPDEVLDPVREWCIVRWASGDSARILLARGGADAKTVTDGGRYDERSRCSFSGPVSLHLGGHGFPGGRIGNIETFATEAEAQEGIWPSGARCVDVATRVDSIDWSVSAYYHHDGCTVRVPASNFEGARAIHAVYTLHTSKQWTIGIVAQFTERTARPSDELAAWLNAQLGAPRP